MTDTKRIITIEMDDFFNVFENGKSTGQLTWDEMLGHIAVMTLAPESAKEGGRFFMRTEAEWAEDQQRREERWRAIEAARNNEAVS